MLAPYFHKYSLTHQPRGIYESVMKMRYHSHSIVNDMIDENKVNLWIINEAVILEIIHYYCCCVSPVTHFLINIRLIY